MTSLNRVPGVKRGRSSVASFWPDSRSQTSCGRPCRRWRDDGVGRDRQAKSIEGKWVGVSSSCPRSSWIIRPLSTSQTRQTMSSATLATMRAVGRGRDARIHLRWASTSRIFDRDSMFHQIKRPSYPPDTSVVARQREPGHVAVMAAKLFRLGLGLVDIDLVDREVRAAAKEPAGAGLRATANTISRRANLFEDLDFSGSAAGTVESIVKQDLTDRFGAGFGQGNGSGRRPCTAFW